MKQLFKTLKNLDTTIKIIMKNGLISSLLICLVATLALATYETVYPLPMLFDTSFAILKAGMMFAVTFFICGIGFDTIQKEKNC